MDRVHQAEEIPWSEGEVKTCQVNLKGWRMSFKPPSWRMPESDILKKSSSGG